MSKSSAIFESLPSAYAYGQLRMNVALPDSNARRDSSSLYVVTALGAAPFLTPSAMNVRTSRTSCESAVASWPSSDRTLLPAL
jgi:hypothetical protein